MKKYILVEFENFYLDLMVLDKDFIGFKIFEQTQWLEIRNNFLNNQKPFFVENIKISDKLDWLRNYKIKELSETEYQNLVKLFGNYIEDIGYGRFIHLD